MRTFDHSEQIPPVGENYLMHLIHHPEDYEDEIVIYQRLPKRRGDRLHVPENIDVTIGWGIHLAEEFLVYKVWGMFTGVFMIGSMVFAMVWATRKSDIQSAFSVAAYICGLCLL
jgi:hypothetical protein